MGISKKADVEDPLDRLAEAFAALRQRNSTDVLVVESQGNHSYTVVRKLKKRPLRK